MEEDIWMDQMASKRYDVMRQVMKWEQWEYQIPGYKENLWSKRVEMKKEEIRLAYGL
jgi:hypothetical protein